MKQNSTQKPKRPRGRPRKKPANQPKECCASKCLFCGWIKSLSTRIK